MASPLHTILQQEMNRKDFIKYVGATLFFVAGGGMIIKAAQSATATPSKVSQGDRGGAAGYGSSVYGGVPAQKS